VASGDDSNGVFMLCVCDHREAARGRHAKRHETPFDERMIRIIARCRQEIEEHARSFIE
jgi:hypothetical protein